MNWALPFLAAIGFTQASASLPQKYQPTGDYFFGAGSKAMSLGAKEAEVSFRYACRMEFDPNVNPDAARAQVTWQVEHLAGSLAAMPFRGNLRKSSVERIEIAFDRATRLSDGSYSLPFEYGGIGAFEREVGNEILVPLPRDPKRIYAQAGKVNGVTPCTDAHYNSEGDFWYFWNVNQAGCALKEGEHYDQVRIALKDLPSTEHTYPEYERLLRDENGVKTLRLYVAYGPVHEISTLDDAFTSADFQSQSFGEISSFLTASGFKRASAARLSASSIRYEYEKTFGATGVRVLLSIYTGNTGLGDQDVITFHGFFKEALASGSMVIYSGHSGLGGNLDLPTLEASVGPIEMPQDLYQVLVFGSCSSYSYYTDMFFERKRTNLDIVSNALSSRFIYAPVEHQILLKSVLNYAKGKRPATWQEIIDQLHQTPEIRYEADWLKDSGAMTIVSGDEDNPTSYRPLPHDYSQSPRGQIVAVAAQKGKQYRNIHVTEDSQALRARIHALANAGHLVYVLTDDGTVHFLESDRDGNFTVSTIMTNLNGQSARLVAFSLSSTGEPIVYIVGADKVLYYKELGKAELVRSARQHPQGLAWVELGVTEQGQYYGIDEAGAAYLWQPSQAGSAWVTTEARPNDPRSE